MSGKIESAHQIRRSYVRYFTERGHTEVPGAGLVPKNDPTLLFTSAGMVQFKENYLQPDRVSYSRAVSVQKCLRAGDLESVGKTLRHHTFFEMLGNFSFGDYFKEEAVDWAWEYVTEILGLETDRIFVSVFKDDDEAYRIWNENIGIPETKIERLGKKDNFWGPVGDTGICGPCSELYFDMGEEVGCGQPGCAPGCDCDRYLEFWNLVFPQFWLDESGDYVPLEKPGIDTGLGLERMATIMQGVRDNFHTDLFLPIIAGVEDIIGAGAEEGTSQRMGVNMIADHARALTFTLAEGIYPSNEGRGYLLRRILRRALTRMYSFGVEEPALFRLVDPVVDVMKIDYPYLGKKKKEVVKVIKAEEDSFFRTLSTGRERFQAVAEEVAAEGGKIISGDRVFMLYDTHGFPPELTRTLAEDSGLGIDRKGFEELMEKQRRQAQEGSSFGPEGMESVSMSEVTSGESSIFTGYESLEESAAIRAYRKVKKDEVEGIDWAEPRGDAYEFIFHRTPFYAESGGQAADSGTIEVGEVLFEVKDVFKRDGDIIHLAEPSRGIEDITEKLLRANKAFLSVDAGARASTAANHTATHLLHAALRSVLGQHVAQAGSFVDDNRLRFDFNHFEGISSEERKEIEDIVNGWIRDSRGVRTGMIDYDEAVQKGVTALFEEKYSRQVRVVSVEGVSAELCGGTHVDNTGKLGVFIITSESSVASGIRRIEAVTGSQAVDYVRDRFSRLDETAALLKVPSEEVRVRVGSLIDECDRLRKQVKKLRRGGVGDKINDLISSSKRVGDIVIAAGRMDVDSINSLRHQADVFRSKVSSGAAVLSMPPGDKLHFIVVVTDDLVEKGITAVKLVDRLKKISGGGGGGKGHLAQLGTKDTSREEEVFEALGPLVEGLI